MNMEKLNLLEVIEFSNGDTKSRGTIVEWIGEVALIEISDEHGVPIAFVELPAHELTKVKA